MGCFNVACNLSSVSMYSDEALWIPLICSDASGKLPMGDNLYIYSSCQFTPVACPVFGNVDSYGRLENIVRNANVEAIEKLFGASIEDIIDEPGNFSVPGLPNSKLSGTFVNKEAFELTKKTLYGDSQDNLACITSYDMKDDILNICNFFFVKEDKTKGRYNRLYTCERYPGVEWWSDGTWGRLYVNDTCHESIFNPIQFLNKLEKVTGILTDENVINILENTWSAKFKIDSIVNRLKVDEKEDEQFDHLDIPELAEIKALLKKHSMSSINMDLFSFSQFESSRWEIREVFEKMYSHNLELYAEDIANLEHLSMAMFLSNRFWSPQANGCQHGSKRQEIALAEFVIQRASRMLKEYNDENAAFYAQLEAEGKK